MFTLYSFICKRTFHMNKSLMLQNMILAEIRVGRLKVGDPILSRNQLCKKYNCSRNTVERAVQALKERGCLASNQGGRTYVNSTGGESHKIRELFIISCSFPDMNDRSLREIFFPEVGPDTPVHRLREHEVLKQLDALCTPGSAAIWVTPGIESIPMMDHLERRGIPQLLINRNYKNFNCACTDTKNSVREGLSWLLIEAGRDIALVSPNASLGSPFISERLIAFYESAAELGARLRSDTIFMREFQDIPTEMSEVGNRLFAAKHPPRGIVVLHSALTLPLVTCARLYGMLPGKDFFLLTYDVIPELATYPGIAMMHQQLEKMFRESQRWLLDGYAEHRRPFHSAIKTELRLV